MSVTDPTFCRKVDASREVDTCREVDASCEEDAKRDELRELRSIQLYHFQFVEFFLLYRL